MQKMEPKEQNVAVKLANVLRKLTLTGLLVLAYSAIIQHARGPNCPAVATKSFLMVNAFTFVSSPFLHSRYKSLYATSPSKRERRHEADRRRRRFRFLQNKEAQSSNMDVHSWREKSKALTGEEDWKDEEEMVDLLIVDGQESRRTFFAKSIPLCAAASTLCGASPAYAASKDPYAEFAYKDKVKAAFQDIKDELSTELPFSEMGNGAGVPYLEGLINSSNWEEIKEFTKFYDGEFRKAKLGYVRKMIMTDKDQKEKATLLSNSVTFDLIGINRAARKSDQSEALRYLGELKDDIQTFLEFEPQLLRENEKT